jgi:membrane fusion protein (multidrug efflux system)
MGARQMIFKVATGPDGKKTSQRLEARIGLRLPGRVEILEGLKAGDTVVTAGHGRLLRGDAVPVRVIDLASPAIPAGSQPSAPAASATRA